MFISSVKARLAAAVIGCVALISVPTTAPASAALPADSPSVHVTAAQRLNKADVTAPNGRKRTPTPTRTATNTPVPTNTPFATDTPVPTDTPVATDTPIPTNTPVSPTFTPVPPTSTPVPPTATAVVPTATATPGGLTEIREQETVNVINDRRVAMGLVPLRVDSALVSAARRHANDIGPVGICSHTGTDGSSPWDRIDQAGYTGWGSGEVVGCGYTTALGVVDGWWNSPGHYAILTDPNNNEVGCGWYINPTTGVGTQTCVMGQR